MKSIINFIIFLSVINLSSCQSLDKKEIDKTIFVDPMHAVSLDIGKSIGEARIVPLETSQESLIIYPDKVIEIQENIYILDKQQDAILLFNKNGKFIKKLIAVGKL